MSQLQKFQSSRKKRRAWKCRLSEEKIAPNYLQCGYTSLRTGVTCKNWCEPSTLSVYGFCPEHHEFIRQLKESFKAEQRRNDDEFIFTKTDEDGFIELSDEDETFTLASDWPILQQDLYNDLLVDDDDENPLRNAGFVTEEEVVQSKLSLLERKVELLKHLHDLFADKSRRRAMIFKKKIAEEAKKGRIVVGSRCEKRLKAIYKANKRHYRHRKSRITNLMNKKSIRRYVIPYGDENESRDNYLKAVCNDDPRICVFGSCTAVEGENVDEVLSTIIETPRVGGNCEKVALPLSEYCAEHILHDQKQRLFAKCLLCNHTALTSFTSGCSCYRHISDEFKHKKKCVRMTKDVTLSLQGIGTCENDRSSSTYTQAASPSQSFLNRYSQPSSSAADHLNSDMVYQTVKSVKCMEQNVQRGQEFRNHSSHDKKSDDGNVMRPVRKAGRRAAPVNSPPPAAGIPSRSIPFEKQAERHNPNIFASTWTLNESEGRYGISKGYNRTSSDFADSSNNSERQRSLFPALDEDLEYSCARIRPFASIGRSTEWKMGKVGASSRFVAVDQRCPTSEVCKESYSRPYKRMRLQVPNRLGPLVLQSLSSQNSNAAETDSSKRPCVSTITSRSTPTFSASSYRPDSKLYSDSSSAYLKHKKWVHEESGTFSRGSLRPVLSVSSPSGVEPVLRYRAQAPYTNAYTNGRSHLMTRVDARFRAPLCSPVPKESPAEEEGNKAKFISPASRMSGIDGARYAEYQQQPLQQNFPKSSARTRLIPIIHSPSNYSATLDHDGYSSAFDNRHERGAARVESRFHMKQVELDNLRKESIEAAVAVASISSKADESSNDKEVFTNQSAQQELLETPKTNPSIEQKDVIEKEAMGYNQPKISAFFDLDVVQSESSAVPKTDDVSSLSVKLNTEDETCDDKTSLNQSQQQNESLKLLKKGLIIEQKVIVESEKVRREPPNSNVYVYPVLEAVQSGGSLVTKLSNESSLRVPMDEYERQIESAKGGLAMLATIAAESDQHHDISSQSSSSPVSQHRSSKVQAYYSSLGLEQEDEDD